MISKLQQLGGLCHARHAPPFRGFKSPPSAPPARRMLQRMSVSGPLWVGGAGRWVHPPSHRPAPSLVEG